jgi:LacI family transcriptional regulator
MDKFTETFSHGLPKSNRRKQVALIIESSNEYARGLLKGIIKYNREHRSWSIFCGEHGRDSTDLSWLDNWKGDGIIARIENEKIAKYIVESNLPVVDLSASRLVPELPFVETNDQSIAHLAAEHLLERGFKHFGYCGNSQYTWSILRGNFFGSCIQRAGYPCYFFNSRSSPNLSRVEERKDIAKWVRILPKPIGIMACFDIQGQQLLEACRMAMVSVPDEVAIIGVDNDPILCELSTPSLSSVVPDAITTGYQSAILLAQIMNRVGIEQKEHLIEPLGIVTRQSTDVLAVNDKLVSDSLKFIREHACDGINVSDILRDLPISRRVLEHKFMKILGRTPYDEILKVKIKTIKQLLVETDLTIAAISERIGFKNIEYMSVVFKRETGVSPSEYRKLH